jgi:hypothetical protein
MGIAEDLNLLDRKLADLKVQYEHYFLALARTEPLKLRAEVQGLIARWNGERITNTMHKFRYQALVGRFNSLITLWNRTVREIEEGTFKGDLFRVSLHEQERREKEERRSKLFAKTRGPGGGEDAGATSRAGDDALYQELLAARAACGQKGEMTRERFEKLLAGQRSEIGKRYDCSEVTFKVKVEKGKVKLVAKPVRKAGRA